MQLEINENLCQCCCQFINDPASSILFSQDVCIVIQELTQIHDFIGPNSNIICYRCNLKLQEFKSFKNEVIKAQQNFKRLMKVEEFETTPSIFVQEIGEIKKEEETFSVLNEYFLPSVKVEEAVEIKPKKVVKRKSSKGVRRRRKDAPKPQDHFCPHCNKYFTESRKVKLHIDRIHKGHKNYSCDQCSYTSFKKYEMFLHLINMHASKEHLQKTATCSICGISFHGNTRLTVHMNRKHLQHIVRKLSCDLCGSRYAALNEMRKHVVTHLPNEMKEFYPCSKCDKRFISKGSLKVHHDNKHTDKPSIKCFCGKEFRQKSVYSRHYQVVHAGLKPYKCSHCNKEFSGKNHLDYHTKAFHTAITLIACEICGNKYKNEDTLKKHIIYHYDPKFSCNLCDAKFHENKKLMDHMSVHEKLQFACQNCTRSFRLESQLRAHLRKVHFKEKLTFRCEMCSSSFTRKSTYRDHALRQHKELNQETMAQFLERIKKSLAEEHKK